MDDLYCPLSIPRLATFFDFSFAPTLLFYSYIPIVIISLFFGFYILYKDKYQLQSKLLFLLSLSFVLWIINIILQWVAVYARIVYLSGQLTAFFEILIFLFSFYFVYVFTEKKDIKYQYKMLSFSWRGLRNNL